MEVEKVNPIHFVYWCVAFGHRAGFTCAACAGIRYAWSALDVQKLNLDSAGECGAAGFNSLRESNPDLTPRSLGGVKSSRLPFRLPSGAENPVCRRCLTTWSVHIAVHVLELRRGACANPFCLRLLFAPSQETGLLRLRPTHGSTPHQGGNEFY